MLDPGETSVVAGVDAQRLVVEASAIQLLPCTCRMTYRRCDKPLETCLILGAYAEEYRARGVGRAVTPPEAAKILTIADREGLVQCVFGARELEGDTLVFHVDKCYGCGLCATTCPWQAIRLAAREHVSGRQARPAGSGRG